MLPFLDILIFLLPWVLVLLLLYILEIEVPKIIATLVAYIVAFLSVWLYWGSDLFLLLAASLKAFILGGELVYMFWASMFFALVLFHSDGISNLIRFFRGIHPDRRVQALIVGWMLTSMVQGVFGFATAGIIGSAILVLLGFPTLAATLMAMLAQSAAATFELAGAPVTFGMREALDTPDVHALLAARSTSLELILQSATVQAALIHGVLAVFLPMVMVSMLTSSFGKDRQWKGVWSLTPFCLASGAAFSIPFVITAVFLGPEFPALIGGTVGLAIIIPMAKFRILCPVEADPWDFPPQEKWLNVWRGQVIGAEPEPSDDVPSWSVLLPFLLAVVIVVVTRSPHLPVAESLRSTGLRWEDFLGTGIDLNIPFLYEAGTLLFACAMVAVVVNGSAIHNIRMAFEDSFEPPFTAFNYFFFLIPIPLMFGVSGFTGAVCEHLAHTLGTGWLVIAPLVGVWSSFLFEHDWCGSYLWSRFYLEMALSAGIPIGTFLAVQLVYGGVSNFVVMHTVSNSGEFVGLLGREKDTMFKLLLPMVCYMACAAVLGLILAYAFTPPSLQEPLPSASPVSPGTTPVPQVEETSHHQPLF